MFYLISWA